MNNQQQQSAEARLRTIAEGAGMTLRELNELFQKAFIDDEKTRQRMIKQQEMEQQYMGNQLAMLQYRNESLSNQLLTYQLERKVRWMNRVKTVRGWFRRSPKKATGQVQPKPSQP